MAKKRSGKKGRRNQAADLTDDLILEILSRLPVRSLFRCKCVSWNWHSLMSHPDHRSKLPQTLAGFFYNSVNHGRFPVRARHFTNVFLGRRQPPLIDPSFSFMPGHENISILDSCNGLLLCRPANVTSLNTIRCTVCNPATESWFVLPDSGCGREQRVARLGFDPVVSSHYHVFEFVDDEDDDSVAGLEIYSSQTGAWSYKEGEWNEKFVSEYDLSVFFNGTLYITTGSAIAAVDIKGEEWWEIDVPDYIQILNVPDFLGRYQGKLCFMSDDQCSLSIWVLECIATSSGETRTLNTRVHTLFDKPSQHHGGAYFCFKVVHIW